MNYLVINEAEWPRATHCAVFRNCTEPAFCITFDLDVTGFRAFVKSRGWSFTMSLIYAVSFCANEIEEFRYRFLDGRVVLYDRIDTAFTYLNAETGLFKVVTQSLGDSMESYVRSASQAARLQEAYFMGPLGNDVFQFSPLPWISYKHISHTNSGKKDQATPLFDWGKYYDQNGSILLPFSIQAHHSFVDGLHIGILADKLQRYLDSF